MRARGGEAQGLTDRHVVSPGVDVGWQGGVHPSASLANEVAAAVQRLRSLDIQKQPGMAESINWVEALALLGVSELDVPAAEQTLGAVLKYRDDMDLVRERGLDWLVGASG